MPCEELDKTAVQVADTEAHKLDLPEGVPALTTLYLYIAGSCNLACRHCWITPTYQPGGNGGSFIKLEYVEKAIREGIPLGLHSVKLTGGEPTLHPHFKEIVALIHAAGLEIIIETNGTLINPSLARYLMDQGVGFISVSLDGATADTHEALRLVPGSFDQAVQGIRALVQAGFHPQMICTLHRGNVAQIVQTVELAESLGCGSIKFNILQQIGRGQKLADEAGLDVPDVLRLFKYVENEVAPNRKIKIHFDIPMAFYPIRRFLDRNLVRCSIHNVLGMLSGGELSMCGIGVTVKELVYGNINQDQLKQVWCQAPGLVSLREQIPNQLEGICGQCIHRDICNGSCVANNYYNSGRLNSPFFFCENAYKLNLFPFSRKTV